MTKSLTKKPGALWLKLAAFSRGLIPHGFGISAKKHRAGQRRQYIRRKKAFLKEHPVCAVFPDKAATQVHHAAGRLNGLLLDESLWVPTSQEGHNRIHQNPNWARGQSWNGRPLLAQAGQWNRPQP